MTQPAGLILTDRLLLRRWRPGDAASYAAALQASVEHLRTWIPPGVGSPASLPELRARLGHFVQAFDEGREWLYGIFARDGIEVLGQVGLYPRTEHARVPFVHADRVEIGYWLRADATRHGYATEAAQGMLGAALALRGIRLIEIRCDRDNQASAAVPRRLGFEHAKTVPDGVVPDRVTLVWQRTVTGR